MVWSVSSYSEIVNEFLSPENLFGSQKSGRFGVRLIVARSSFRLAYNGLGLGEVGDFEALMFNKPQMLIEVQMFNLAILPPFCQTPVSGSYFYSFGFIFIGGPACPII